MKHEVSHDLGQAKAREVAQKAFAAYQTKFAEYEPKVNWKTENAADISFCVKGMKLNGEIEVSDKTIGVDLDVPFLLRPFKGKALEVIEAEIREWIGRAKAEG
jgi:isopentenyl diphosphate isomerase/L-lactate dehydrogenase-like FMN-dependent dehydrogenase